MLYSDSWKDYALLDAAHGEKIEKWGDYILRRPDPQAIWQEESGEVYPIYKFEV